MNRTGEFPPNFASIDNDIVDSGFGVIDVADGYILLKRGPPGKDLPDEFFTLFLVCGYAAPQYPAMIDFGDKVRFLGYDVLTDQYGHAYMQTYWQRLGHLDQNYFLFPFVADEDGETLFPT